MTDSRFICIVYVLHAPFPGDHACGKTKLIDTFRSAIGLDAHEETKVNDYALSYSYFDAVDPDDKDERDGDAFLELFCSHK